MAEVLLQRSRGTTVAKVYEELFRRWPDARALSRARESSIASTIRPLGLVGRAGPLRAMASEVTSAGGVPSTFEGLMTLPGVGRYAANATLVVGFGRRAPVVDGVTARVYRRFFGLSPEVPPSEDPELWALVDRATPTDGAREWNWAALDLAATICLPARPRCGECPLAERCTVGSSAA